MTVKEAYQLTVYLHKTYCNECEGFHPIQPHEIPWDDEGWVKWDDIKALIHDCHQLAEAQEKMERKELANDQLQADLTDPNN